MSNASLEIQTTSRARRDLLFSLGGATAAGLTAVTLRGQIPSTDASRKDASTGSGQANMAADHRQLVTDLEAARTEAAKLKAELEAVRQVEASRAKARAILRAPAWTELDLNAFLSNLSTDELARMRKALNLETPGDAKVGVAEIKKQLHKSATSMVGRLFANAEEIQYHEKVKWVAKKAGVHSEIVDSQSTFVIERELSKKLFSDMWDKLNPDQRKKLLTEIDSNGSIRDAAGMVALSGSAAVAALSATVYMSGFGFYTTMSVAASSMAAAFGITLSFGAYTGLSSAVAFLSGPAGWAIAALAGAAGLAIAGRADWKETTAAVLQIHLIKAAQLKQAAPSAPDDIFEVIGRKFPS